jgi:quercetin dioxygenase-like cupin family protein
MKKVVFDNRRFKEELALPLGETLVAEEVERLGFSPMVVSNHPGFTYATHSHPEAKLLVILEGSMKLSVEGKEYDARSGDLIVIPGNTEHSALVGKKGCRFYWAEKLVNEDD